MQLRNERSFYRELLECWLEFRNLFLADKERHCIIWNNQDIRIDGKPVFYKSYYDSGILSIIKDLLFNLDNIEPLRKLILTLCKIIVPVFFFVISSL